MQVFAARGNKRFPFYRRPLFRRRLMWKKADRKSQKLFCPVKCGSMSIQVQPVPLKPSAKSTKAPVHIYACVKVHEYAVNPRQARWDLNLRYQITASVCICHLPPLRCTLRIMRSGAIKRILEDVRPAKTQIRRSIYSLISPLSAWRNLGSLAFQTKLREDWSDCRNALR